MFRKFTFSALFLLLAYTGLSAQEVQFYFSDTLYQWPQSECWVGIKVNSFNEIGTLQFTMKWDHTYLMLDQTEQVGLNNMIINVSDSTITGVWISLNGTGQTLPDSTIILRLKFKTGAIWPVTTPISFEELSTYHFDGSQLIEVPAVWNQQIVVIRECHTEINIATTDTLCYLKNMVLEPVQCIQCSQVIWNDSIIGFSYTPSQSDQITAIAVGALHCFDTSSIFIAPSPTADIIPQNLEICPGESGELLVDVSLNTLVSWSTGDTSKLIFVFQGGKYTAWAKNIYGCLAVDSATVKILDIPEINLSIQNINGFNIHCADGNDGMIVANAGNNSTLFNWSNGASGSEIYNLPVGTYTVTVTDDQGCTNVKSIDLTAPPELIISTNATHPTCIDSLNGSISIDISGGVPGYLIVPTGGTSENFQNLGVGTYTYNVMDKNGCGVNLEVKLASDEHCSSVNVYFPNVFSPDSGDDNRLFTFFTDQPDRVRPIDFKVFDRWGNLVYHTGDGELPEWDGSWNGQDCIPGVYIWQMVVENDNKDLNYSGEVSLLR